MKLQRIIKETKQEKHEKWYEKSVDVHDVTGDSDILIVRILNDDGELKGLWLERKHEEWACLQEEIDEQLIEMVLQHPKVIIFTENIVEKKEGS